MKAGWKSVTLGEVIRIASGLVDPRDERYADLPHIGGANIASGSDHLIDVKTAREEKLTSGKYAFDHRAVLYSKIRPYLRKVARPSFDGLCSADVYPLWPDPRLDRNYLFHLLLGDAFTAYAVAGSDRAGMPKVNRPHLVAFTFDLPPLEVQKLNIAILDEAMEGLSRAYANVEANISRTQELYEGLLTAAFSVPGPERKVTKLGAVATFRNGLNFTQSSHGSVVKIVGVGDFQDNFWIPDRSLASVQIDGALSDADRLAEGDLLAVRSNGNRELIGRAMLAGPMDEPISFSGFTIRIRLETSEILPEYLCHFLRTGRARHMLSAAGGGANISNLNQRILADFEIAFPDTFKQREILDKIALAVEATAQLRERYEQELLDLNALRQSLRQKALAGQLI